MLRSTLEPGPSATAGDPLSLDWVPVLRRGLAVVMWLLLAAYLVGLAVHGHGFEPLVDAWLAR